MADGTKWPIVFDGIPEIPRGPKPIGEKAMDSKERQRRYREKLKAAKQSALVLEQGQQAALGPLRILAISDIHGHIAAVEHLRERESNSFDAIVVAGDIGNQTASQIFDILKTFEVPVLYVYRNHDIDLDYEQDFGFQTHHLHLAPIVIGSYAFVGYSGLTKGSWGRNPIADSLFAEVESQFQDTPSTLKDLERKQEALARASIDALRENRRQLASIVQEFGSRRCIVVTHDRQTRTIEDMPAVPLFLFGHIHGYKNKPYRGSRFINVSALDCDVVISPDFIRKPTPRDMRRVNMGSYIIIEIDTAGRIDASANQFMTLPKNWSPVSYVLPDWQIRPFCNADSTV